MKDNKLIAEFMRLPTEVFNSGIMNYHHDGAWYEEHELSYEKSWDWLMPVVQKCLDVSNDDNIEDFYSIQNVVPNIEATYHAVVEFINQLNKEES